MRLLTVNAGSSSVKLRLLEDGAVTHAGDLSIAGEELDPRAVDDALTGWPKPDVVGHRVVHGGTQFSSAVRITPEVERQLQDLTDLAPLHQPKSLAGLRAAADLLPDVPAAACFDTAFHATIPPAAATYAIPQEWRDRGVRRYGFHGLSHAYVSRRACELADLPVDGTRVVTCHLGAGASLCAVQDGRSVDTTMGFTPLEGLVMATRSGTVDPGMVLWLEEHQKLSPAEVTQMLESGSGMLALAGTKDQREVEAGVRAGDRRATAALEVQLHRLVTSICAMAGSMGGVDVLAFTGGVGEHSSLVRQSVCRRLDWLGVAIDEARNDSAQPDLDLTGGGARVRSVVVTAREELEMAREIAALDLSS
ncbi:acetate/propionate family kinase [Microlunatus sp. Gsoil 973]|uniref:acetate/propionate family kinase n=1 Tax=Microlunatus sp. Gsoil 973 TaxID=2672569 RepID=UPI0012B4F0C5|nr:acetate/propionate family kinase [Microlunatus sp. Gsoil 973]QGN33467.1 acetate/propionate family kinase [Microlunatus sp. Gsoil 973]